MNPEIDVFILSKNRGGMIGRTIQSLLDQTITFPITVLDNGSTDNTEEVVKAFDSPLIKFCPILKSIDIAESFKRPGEMATGKYMMVFHDDDQLHPAYLETALQRMEENPHTDLLVPNKTNIAAGSTPAIPATMDQSAIKLDQQHFAAALFLQNDLAFPGAIYTTETWKALDPEAILKRFGIWGDRPIMIEAIRSSKNAIILNGPWVFYGRHATQNTKLKQSQPHHSLWLNREAYYREILGDDRSTFPGKCFYTMNPRNLKSGFKRRIAEGPSFSEYLQDAFKAGATTPQIWKSRFLTPKPAQQLFNRRAQAYLKKKFDL